MPDRARLALAAVLAAGTLAACTTSEPGQATGTRDTGGTSAGSAPSSGGAAPTVAIPPRPKELALGDVQPCSLFTKPQLDQLKVNRPPRSGTDQGAYKGMRECHLNVEAQPPFYTFDILAVTTEGIDAWLTGKRNVEAKLSDVGGYAAATYWARGANGKNTDGCSTSVDVAKGQQLIIGTDNDGAHSFTLDQLCQRAEQAAGMAVQTLQTLR